MTLSSFAQTILDQKYAMKDEHGRVLESWSDVSRRVATNVLGAVGYGPNSNEVQEVFQLIRERKFLPGGRYLYASGRDLHQVNNCLLLRCEDSREGWSQLFWQAGMALMTGAGIGVEYSQVRPRGAPVRRTGGLASGPLSPMRIVNELGRDVQQGGSRRSAIWAGLSWKHPDVFDFIKLKDWHPELRKLKINDPWIPMEMELTNISISLDDEFFKAIQDRSCASYEHAHRVYWEAIKRMAKTGEPGFSVNVNGAVGEDLRNACTEITSSDDSDICNLGSLNLGQITSKNEFAHAVELATLFLLSGTVYSHVPYQKVADVREKNRRLGLGLMGMHEWLLLHDRPYSPDAELGEWLDIYSSATEIAGRQADELSLSTPVKTRAIAPNGTIGIIGETTTGIEPVFCIAYKRRYLRGREWMTEHVLDPVASRLIASGVRSDKIEDAYSLAQHGLDRRLAFQAWVQKYVDHGISSTLNLPRPLIDSARVEDFGAMLLHYLPKLRGVTVYPNGARAGQPIEAISYREAIVKGAVEEAREEACINGVCGV